MIVLETRRFKMITKIVTDENGKKTEYIIKDEPKVKEEIDKLFSSIHSEMDKAMKFFDEIKFPELNFPKFSFPEVDSIFEKFFKEPKKVKSLKSKSK